MNQTISKVVSQAKEFMEANSIDGWLLYDYRGMNPIFWDTVGEIPNVTRPCWLWIPTNAMPRLIVSYVDQNRFEHLGIETNFWVSRDQMIGELQSVLSSATTVAMEYSPMGTLPRASKVDGGTLELVRSLEVSIVTSSDLIQYATQRWDDGQLETHLIASNILTTTVKEAYDFIGENIQSGPTEYDVAEFIRSRFDKKGLYSPDGPVVAANAHAADPHFDPTEGTSVSIKEGDWILIDLWGKLKNGYGSTSPQDAMYGDITWTAYVGTDVPSKHQEVFKTVIGARDAAISLFEKSYGQGRELEGWELDSVARKYINQKGYGDFFSHRLGHSLGREVHSNAVNLDGWETNDTRHLLPRIAVTIEPGIYLPGEFGVRSEIDIFYYEEGPKVTTERQTEPYLIKV
ncbi:MAG: M24 family metallopeptidase [Chloroflexota bacterium]|nr:M24 family metallopeptidase [Chloroflexota bacterium]